MASLYLGRRRGPAGFARHVAIKVVHESLAKEHDFIEMFLDEARLSARIHHPNVVHVEQLGEADGYYYLVMEYVQGAALSQLLKALGRNKRALGPELAVWIAIQVADGLHAAHETKDEKGQPLGVVHRDVSPQNLLLAYDGHVKLIDFGIAKAEGHLRTAKDAGMIKGKIRYMAPEQALGRDVDARADVWALGVVLWEMLTMRRLFKGDNMGILNRLRSGEGVPPPSLLNPEVSPELDRAVLHALAPNLEARTRTADDFRDELADALPGALRKRAKDLASVMYGVMADEIERELEVLPESLAAGHVEEPTAIERAQAVDEHTTVLESDEYAAEDDDPAAAPRVEPPDASDSVTTAITGTTAHPSLPMRGGRSRVLLALAAVGVIGALAVGAYVLGARPAEEQQPVVGAAPGSKGHAAKPPPRPKATTALAVTADGGPETQRTATGTAEAGVRGAAPPTATADTREADASGRTRARRARRRRSHRAVDGSASTMAKGVGHVGGMPFLDQPNF